MVTRALLCGLVLASWPALACAQTQKHTVWQIGNFDDSSREFHDSFGVDYSKPASNVDYTIGKSTLSNWLRFQPGNANGLAGGRLHPFRIHFTLPQQPRGTYMLKLAMLYETPRLSKLRVELGGHTGLFTFAPKLDYAAGDWEGTFVPHTSHAERSIALPAAWLREGENTITLTAIDDPATPQNSLGDIAPGESGLIYDALALEQVPEPYAEGGTATTAVATIFFRGSPTGPREVVSACVDAHVDALEGALPKQIELTLAGHTEIQPLDFGSADFGEACALFAVPEWKGTAHGIVRVSGKPTNVDLVAQKKWTILIVPHEHLDIGFTDYREKVAELQSQSIDGVLDLLPGHPEFRWTMDGSWIAQQFMAARSPERVQEFLIAVRAGKIIVPAQYANQHTGVASLEGLAHSLYYSQSLANKFRLPIGAANITDVPSYSWSYASILHSAGIQYFAAASNSWRAPILLKGRWNEKSPFYWEGPDGGRVLMWYSRAYLQLASMFGTPPMVEAVHDALPVFLQAYSRKDYRADSVILFGSQLENTALDAAQATLPSEWAKQYVYPRLEFSTFHDAMVSIEEQFKQFNGTILTYRGDFGPYWEDGFTSGAQATAMHRANQQRLLNAETMATIPSLLNPATRPDHGLLDDAWQNSMLFDEHTWTSVGATTQPESEQTVGQFQNKAGQAFHARDDLEQSIHRSFAQLEATLAPRDASLVIFNGLNWSRGGWLEADIPEGKQIADPETHQPVPQDILRVERGTLLPGFGGRTVRVRYHADNVPAVGYKLLSIVDAPPSSSSKPAQPQGETLENNFYRMTLDPASGSIRSIWDKALNRELVDAHSPYRFGSYVYVTGADDMPNNSLYRFGATLPMPTLTSHPASGGRLVSLHHGAAFSTAILESSAPNTDSIRTTVTLPSDIKRIDIAVSLHKTATLKREAAYIAFPLAIEHPSFAYDTQNGYVDPARDELAGGSREWYATQHWAAIHDDAVAAAIIPIDAPMLAFGDIVRGAWPDDFVPRSSTIFSWLMSNYWSTNFMSSQGGDFTFRYSFVSAAEFDPAQLTRTGWEQMTPLESDPVYASFTPSPITSASFLKLDNPNIVVSTWKRAESGAGSILRLTEIAGRPEVVNLSVPHLQLLHAQQCSLLEVCAANLPVSNNSLKLELKPYEIVTLRLETLPEKMP
ncbi:MAG: polysaccharide lyase family protein [Acidobacteriaceae bacterium]